jgi:hypothetical protein
MQRDNVDFFHDGPPAPMARFIRTAFSETHVR